MLNVKYSYSGKNFILEPYTTVQEKNLLLLGTIGETDIDIDMVLSMCGVDSLITDSLTLEEKKAFLLKLREISVGSEVNINFKCDHCKTESDNIINIENIITPSKIINPKIIDRFKTLTEDNISDFVSGDTDNLDICEYEIILAEIKNSITQFDFVRPVICQRCSTPKNYYIGKTSFIVDIMSEDSIISIYQTYNDMVFFGTYSKLDIDSLYPFERTILLSLLNKTREDLS